MHKRWQLDERTASVIFAKKVGRCERRKANRKREALSERSDDSESVTPSPSRERAPMSRRMDSCSASFDFIVCGGSGGSSDLVFFFFFFDGWWEAAAVGTIGPVFGMARGWTVAARTATWIA